jgi:hypothetical protein
MKRKKNNPAEPTGRLDILASRLLGHVVSESQNPLAAAVHEQFRPEIEKFIGTVAGPGGQFGKAAGRVVAAALDARRRAGRC